MFDFKDLIVAAGIALFVGAGGSWYVTHKIDSASFEEAKRVAAEETQQALISALNQQQEALDKQHAIALAEMASQRIVARKTVTITKEVEIHVPVDMPCPSVGFVRVLDAEASGAASADELPLPGGVTDGTCAPISYRALAKVIIGNYGLYHALGTRHAALAAASAVKPTSPAGSP